MSKFILTEALKKECNYEENWREKRYIRIPSHSIDAELLKDRLKKEYKEDLNRIEINLLTSLVMMIDENYYGFKDIDDVIALIQ